MPRPGGYPCDKYHCIGKPTATGRIRETVSGWRAIRPGGSILLNSRRYHHPSLETRIGQWVHVRNIGTWAVEIEVSVGEPGETLSLWCVASEKESETDYQRNAGRSAKRKDRSKPIDQDMRLRINRIREGKPLQTDRKGDADQGDSVVVG